MGHIEIVNKLERFLKDHVPPKEEAEVVYFLVESRKIIEQGSENYSILK